MIRLVPRQCQTEVDYEIWTVTGAGWRLPIGVEFHGHRSVCKVRIGAGVRLLERQRGLLKKVLDHVGTHKAGESQNSWWMPPKVLRAFAVKSVCNDPEDTIIWTVEAKRDLNPIFASPLSNEFLDFYCRDGLIDNHVTASAVYQDFCNHGLRWMLLYEKPWDIGFAVLHPTPLRPDWKEIMAQVLDAKYHGERKVTRKLLAEENLLPYFIMPELISLMKKNLVHWGIEVKLKKGWILTSARIEETKRKAKGMTRYCMNVIDTLKRHLPRHCEIFLAYLTQTRLPSAHIRKDERGNKPLLMRGISKEWESKSISTLRLRLFQPIIFRRSEAYIRLGHFPNKTPRGRKPVVETPARLPEMPDLQPDQADLRHTWHEVE